MVMLAPVFPQLTKHTFKALRISEMIDNLPPVGLVTADDVLLLET